MRWSERQSDCQKTRVLEDEIRGGGGRTGAGDRRLGASEIGGRRPDSLSRKREEEVARSERGSWRRIRSEPGPLFRVKVLKLEEDESRVALHHAPHRERRMVDGDPDQGSEHALSSLSAKEEESPLPELEIQYADFAVWQREYLAGEVLEDEVGYWRGTTQGCGGVGTADRPAEAGEPGYRGASERVTLGHSVSEGLRRLSRREGATLFMTLMAAFKVV